MGKACAKLLSSYGENPVMTDNNVGEAFLCVDNEKYEMLHPNEIVNGDFDEIIISNLSRKEIRTIKEQLIDKGIFDNIRILADDPQMLKKVVCSRNFYDEETDKRVNWLREYAGYVRESNIKGNVAECGVLYGDFSYYINKYFAGRKLYLFDTFAGFDDRDIEREPQLNDSKFSQWRFSENDTFSTNDIEIVEAKLYNKEECIFKKG